LERQAIETTIARFEKRKVDDLPRENMSKMLKELNLVMEFRDATDTMEKSLIAQVKAKNLPKDEEEEQIEFVRDAVRLQRDKYQP
jgi:hypothetical protein